MRNVFWNFIFCVDFGGCIALALYALARWPGMFQTLGKLFYVLACSVTLVLIVGFIFARLKEWRWRGDTGRPARGYMYGTSSEYSWYHDQIRRQRRR